MGIILMGTVVNHIVQLRVAGVVQVKLHLFARSLFVETVSKKDQKIAMTENPTQMKMTRSTVKMIAQDLLPGIDVTQNLHLNAKLVETESKILLLLGMKKNVTMEILRTMMVVPLVVCLKSHIVETVLLKRENTVTMEMKMILQIVSTTVQQKL